VLSALAGLKQEGIEVIVFGDIFLEDLRMFRERLLGQAGLEGSYPLWGRDSEELYQEFAALGFRAVTVCVDTERLTEGHCGQLLDQAFRASLPAGVDPCGERGEYHSFTFDGPCFQHPVSFRLGELHRQAPFLFQELFPGTVRLPCPAPSRRQSMRVHVPCPPVCLPDSLS
jgi:diphthamide synthase (EF-2-diphthine--ammonia ligase)